MEQQVFVDINIRVGQDAGGGMQGAGDFEWYKKNRGF